MKFIRTITRWLPRWGINGPPWAQEVSITLYEALGNHYVIVTPWACLTARDGAKTTDGQMAAALRTGMDTEEAALQHAKRVAKHWNEPDNLTVNGRLHDAIRWDGELVGTGRLADALEVSTERLYSIARGEVKATKEQAEAAQAYSGRRL